MMEFLERENVRDKNVVLVVDGDCARRFSASIVLQRLGYRVFSTATAEEALLITEIAVPLVVITDFALPQMDGVALVRSIKGNPRTCNVPAIVADVKQDPARRILCEEAGCSIFLMHPIDHNELYAAIQNVTEATPRQFVRLAASLDVIIDGGASAESGDRKEQVTAISECGMYIGTANPLPRGTVAPFTLFLDRSTAWGIRLEGRVLHSHRDSGQGKIPGMGVQFTLIRPEDRATIRAFIRNKLLEGVFDPGKTS